MQGSSPKTEARPPRVSIGVAVYNGERFLEKTLDSLLAQTYRDFELIICDNCSSDRTEEICRTYAARDSRIRYLRNASNSGAPRNFNQTFTLARGEYFKWSCADDLCGPELVEHCLEVLDRRPNAVLCYPQTRLIDEHDAVVNNYEDLLDLPYEAPSKRLKHLLWNIWMCNAQFGLMRSSVMRQTKLLGTYPNSDLAFLAELALYGRFVEIPEPLFFRRIVELSVRKYPSAQERMVMFDPKKAASLSFPNWRLFAAHFSAIHRTPLTPLERLRCYAKLHILFRRRGNDLAKDLRFALKQMLAPGSHRARQNA